MERISDERLAALIVLSTTPRFRCYAEGNEGSWEALCVDLDLAVQGTSFLEVYNLLNDAIATYSEDASREDAAIERQLLARRAPLRVRLAYALKSLWHYAGSRHDGHDGIVAYRCLAVRPSKGEDAGT